METRVAQLPGVHRAVVNFAAGRLDAEHGSDVTIEEIEKAVEEACFEVGRTEEVDGPPFWRTPRALLTLASALLFALGLALGLTDAPDLVRVGAYALAILVGGLPIFRAALAGLRARHLDMNVLMSAATIGAAAIGEWAEAASVVVLFAVGNALQVYAIDRTRGAVRAIYSAVHSRRGYGAQGRHRALLGPSRSGWRRRDRRGASRGASGHRRGDRRGRDHGFNEAPVTGEGVPGEKGPDDTVFSGSLNGSGGLLVRVSRKAEDSTLQRIARLVEEAQAKKVPVEQFVDRFSRVYTPAVVAVALTLAVVPLVLEASFGNWFYRALALLIIACPCSLVIPTPVTVVSGIGAASRRGILIKGGAALEAAGRLKALAFDKTGTLTEGRPPSHA